MDDRQLIEDLLSALEYHTEQTRPIEFSKVAIEAAREYLRKPAQPYKSLADYPRYWIDPVTGDVGIGTPFATAQRTWQGLTDEEIEQGCKESWVTEQAWQSAVWWAEAKLRGKNENRN